jgi:hypothetical protein
MPCDRIGNMIVCSRGKRRATRCGFCRLASTKLCDAEIGRALSGKPITCDAPICNGHATPDGIDRDLCPKHSKP